MDERLDPVGAPTLPVVREQQSYTGPPGWTAPDVARNLARTCDVEVVSVESSSRWFGLRERMQVSVCGRADAVSRFWAELEDMIGVRRSRRIRLGDLFDWWA